MIPLAQGRDKVFVVWEMDFDSDVGFKYSGDGVVIFLTVLIASFTFAFGGG